jgi:site-specific DNA recombinase
MHSPVVRRAGIYTRISKQVEGRNKVGDQEADCRALAKREGYDVAEVYVDDGISASSDKRRPGWDQMLADISARKFDVLLAVEESRFTRRNDAKAVLVMACIATGVRWHTVREGEVDPATADGEFMAIVRGAMSRLEAVRKGERQRSANAARRARGEPMHGPRIFGFEPDRIAHRSEEARELVWAYEHIADGGSVYSIARSWNDRGIKTASNYRKPGKSNDRWSYQSVRQVLLNPRNAAIYTHNGAELPVAAVWQPIVTREMYETVRALLTDPARRITDQREPRWLLAGVARCGVCGGLMRSSRGSSRGKSWPVYRCTSKLSLPTDDRRHAAIKTDVLDELARSAVAAALIFGSSAVAQVADPDVAEGRRLRARQADVGAELDAAVEQAVRAKSPRTKSAAQRLVDQLEAEELSIRDQLDAIERQSARAALLSAAQADLIGHGRVELAKVAESKGRLEAAFEVLPLTTQRTLVRELLEVVVNPGREKGRVDILQKQVPSLNEDDELAAL